jgi:hypothetical protein
VQFEVRSAKVRQHLLERGPFRSLQGLVDQMHRRWPPERRLLQGGELVLAQRAPIDLAEQTGQLLAGQSQVTRVELEDVAARPHPLEAQRGNRARRHQHAHATRQVAKQRVHHRHHLGVPGHFLEVVEHQEMGRSLEGRQLVGQRARQHLDRTQAGPCLLQGEMEVAPEARVLAPESLEQVAAEHHRVRVGPHQ